MTRVSEQTTAGAQVTEGVSRRTIVKSAAWSIPVIAVAVAAPMAAASGDVAVNGFVVAGTCGTLGIIGAGFTITAGATAIPAGTTITVQTGGVAQVNALGATGLVGALLISGTTATYTLSAPLAPGAVGRLTNLVSAGVAVRGTATLTLPTGYVAGTGTKAVGTVTQVAVLCQPS